MPATLPPPLHFVTADDPPLSFYDAAAGDWTGFVPSLLRYIIDHGQQVGLLRDDLAPTFYAPSGVGGASNSTYSRALAELTAGRANASAFALAMVSDFVGTYDLSFPFATTGYSVLTKTVAPPTSAWKFIKPFSPEVWGMVAGLVVIGAVLLYAVDRASPFGYRRMAPTPHERREMGFPLSLYRVVIALLKMEPHAPEAWSSRAVFLAIVFFILFLVTSFESAYNAIEVAAQKNNGDITSLNDLAALGRPFGVVESTMPETWFLSNPSPLIRGMAAHKVKYRDLASAVAALRDGSVSAVIGNTQSLAYWASVQPCELKFAGEPLTSSYWAVAMPLGAEVPRAALGPAASLSTPLSWKTLVNLGIAAAEEAGYIDVLLRRFFLSSGGCGLPALVSSSNSAGHPAPGSATYMSGVRHMVGGGIASYQLDNFGGIFIVYAVMVGVGWLLLGVEVVFYSPAPDPIPFVRKMNKWLGAEYHFVVESLDDGGRGGGGLEKGGEGDDDGGSVAGGGSGSRSAVLSSAGPGEVSPARSGYRLSVRPAHGHGGGSGHGHGGGGSHSHGGAHHGAPSASSHGAHHQGPAPNHFTAALGAAGAAPALHDLTGIAEEDGGGWGEGDDGDDRRSVGSASSSAAGSFAPPPRPRRGSAALDMPPAAAAAVAAAASIDANRRRSFSGAPALGSPARPHPRGHRHDGDADADDFAGLSDVSFDGRDEDEDAPGARTPPRSSAHHHSRYTDSSMGISEASEVEGDEPPPPPPRPLSSYRPPSLAALGGRTGSLRLRHGSDAGSMSLFSQSLRSLQAAFGSAEGGGGKAADGDRTAAAGAGGAGDDAPLNAEAGAARRSSRVTYLLRRSGVPSGGQ